jgi:hypothetical protein
VIRTLGSTEDNNMLNRSLIIVICFSLISCSNLRENEKINQNNYKKTDSDVKLLELSKEALTTFLKSRLTASGWTITVNPDKNIVETNWYREHKGEVVVKSEIRIHEGLIRVDVWQRVGLLFTSDIKNERTRYFEWAIQKQIEKTRSQSQ